ncbi:MAG: DUF4831 family protein [Bacteroidota bacterium]
MKRKIPWILMFILMMAIQVSAQINVMRIDNSAVPETREGIFYSLPRTVVKIDVKIDRIENYKGPYSDFAMKLLGLKNVIAANSVDYKISEITITTYPEPDPDQYYFIEPGEKISKDDKAGMIALSDAGVILGTIPQTIDQAGETILIKNGENTVEENEKDLFGELFKYSADVSVFEKVDTIIRKINLDTITVERQFYKRTVIEKSPEQKAREAADFISKIKENRFNLISGTQEVNYNRETLEYMDVQLKMMEKEYMKLFTGVSLRKSLDFSYKFIPVPNQINTEIPIFKFLKSRGIVDLDESGGKIVTIKIQRVGNTSLVSGYLNKAVKVTKFQGLTYRIPEVAKVTVKYDETIQETQCLINQLGVVASLPASKWKVLYYKETGGIKGLEIQ